VFGLKRGWVGICHLVLLIRGQYRVYNGHGQQV
jgi:hypothetical protein